MNNSLEVTASPPKVERQESGITISFSVGDLPVVLNLTEKQAKRISEELKKAVSAG